MATRINNLEGFGKASVAELRNVAKEAIARREAIRELGKTICKAVAFDNQENYMVIFNEKKVENIH